MIPVGLSILTLPLQKFALCISDIRLADRSVVTLSGSVIKTDHSRNTFLDKRKKTWSWNPTLALSGLGKQRVSIRLLSISDGHESRQPFLFWLY